jgi:uncharacterized membrane protein
MTYLLLKYWHILSAFLLFGTGLGSAFYKWMADRNGDIQHIAITNRHVVLADWIFTTPSIIFQPITGVWMVSLINLPLTTSWIAISLGLYFLAGICWLPVVYLQIKMQRLSEQAVQSGGALPAEYWQYARIWFWLGVPAFLAMVIVIYLMINKGFS